MEFIFDKMHGLGNDFVFISQKKKAKTKTTHQLTPEGIRFICDRKLGIGCDTLIVYETSGDQVTAKFFNADGSQAEICINASRCLALLLHMQWKFSSLSIVTDTKTYETKIVDDKIFVNLGKPSFSYEAIGIKDDSIDLSDLLSHLTLSKTESSYINRACAVSVGNPHLILFLNKDMPQSMKQSLGNKLEKSPFFANRINVSFAKILNNLEIELEVFERGVGLTLACGSGACATAFMAHKLNLIGNKVRIKQPGGDLEIFIREGNSIVQKGSATYVFHGNIKLTDTKMFEPIQTPQQLATTKKSKKAKTTKEHPKPNKQEKSSSHYCIYTDGACSGNPGPGGWGAVIINGQEKIKLGGGDKTTTNNKMELTAPIMALKELPEGSTVEIFTDSAYVKNGITKWIKGWEKNNWRTSSGTAVKNKEQWVELKEQITRHKVTWSWVKGHNGNPNNELADNLARSHIPQN